MFATLLGPYPSDPEAAAADGSDERVRAVVEELEEAGLEPLSDGGSAAGPLDRPAAVAARWRFAAGCSERAVKQALVGPYTLAREARGAGSGSAADAADRIGETVDVLVAAGCPLIEIEEPAAVHIGEGAAERRRFTELHRALTEGRADRVHLSLVLTGGNVDTAGAATLFDLPYASYAFDLIAGPDNWRLVAQAPGDRGIVCGALDPSPEASDRPEVLVWASHYAASTAGRGLVRVGLANASSLAGLDRERARRKVRALGEAARLVAVGSTDDLAAALDPRAVDIRSAAMGRYRPRRDPRGKR
jgi:methionine synthase II (cobalamin-independent)